MSSLSDIERIPQGASDLAQALSTQAVPGLIAARQSVQHTVDGMFKCISFNGNAASWQSLGLWLNSLPQAVKYVNDHIFTFRQIKG